MPTYPYACTTCDHRFEVVQAFTDQALSTCEQCGGRLRKVFSSVGVVFKGSGFYRNDSRSPVGAGSGAAGSSASAGASSDSSGANGSSNNGSGASGGSNGSGASAGDKTTAPKVEPATKKSMSGAGSSAAPAKGSGSAA